MVLRVGYFVPIPTYVRCRNQQQEQKKRIDCHFRGAPWQRLSSYQRPVLQSRGRQPLLTVTVHQLLHPLLQIGQTLAITAQAPQKSRIPATRPDTPPSIMMLAILTTFTVVTLATTTTFHRRQYSVLIHKDHFWGIPVTDSLYNAMVE